MKTQPIEKDIVIKRIDGIMAELAELRRLGQQDVNQFSAGDAWKLAQFHLHRALEGVFNISTHILSRIPGGQATQYKEIAVKMGELGVVPKDFAANRFVEMAKYRNRLVHFYAEVSAAEAYGIIQNDLGDFDVFLSSIKNLLDNPQALGLTIE